jgi:hypothetical protein
VAIRSNGRNGVLLFSLLATVFLLPYTSARAQSKSNEKPASRIILKILNGKTGWPIWTEFPNVWLGGANSPQDPPPRANWRGEIKLDIPASGPREVRVLPNWFIDCRSSADPFAGTKMKYSIDEILNLGIVAENICGEPHTKLVPGTLILYFRPRTWKEIMEL